MSLYVKSPIEKMNDKLEKELNSIPDELTFEAIDTNYICPDCETTPLKKLKFLSANNQLLSADWDMLYCTECNKYYYLHDIIWKLKGGSIDGGGGGTVSGGSKVKVVNGAIVITNA